MVGSRPSSFRSRWWRVVQIVMSAGLIGWVLSGLDADGLLAARKLSPALLLLALFFLSLSQVWGGVRLWLLLRRQGSPLHCVTIIRLTWVGFFTSNFLPSTIGGDVADGALLVRSGVGGKVVVAALVMDRLVNMATVISLTVGCVVVGQLWTIVTGGHIGLPARILAMAGFSVLGPRPPSRLVRAKELISTG